MKMLPPGMWFAEVVDLSLLFLRRIEELRWNHEAQLLGLLKLTRGRPDGKKVSI